MVAKLVAKLIVILVVENLVVDFVVKTVQEGAETHVVLDVANVVLNVEEHVGDALVVVQEETR